MENKEKDHKSIKFENGELLIDESVSTNVDDVWLTAQEIADLYETSVEEVLRIIDDLLASGECTIKDVRVAPIDRKKDI